MAQYRLYQDDCLNINKYCRKVKFDLIYLDPPFGTGSAQNLGDHSYDDCAVGEEYLSFIAKRISKISTLLSDKGTLLIHLDRHYVYEVKNILDPMGIPFKGDIIWAYRRWASNVSSLQSNHDTILVYSHDPSFKKGRTVFSQSIVAPSSKERVGYPTQKPIGLIKKIITLVDQSNETHTILDPFMGSGTTLVAGLEMGKKVYGFDISKDAIKIVEARLKNKKYQQMPLTQIEL